MDGIYIIYTIADLLVGSVVWFDVHCMTFWLGMFCGTLLFDESYDLVVGTFVMYTGPCGWVCNIGPCGLF